MCKKQANTKEGLIKEINCYDKNWKKLKGGKGVDRKLEEKTKEQLKYILQKFVIPSKSKHSKSKRSKRSKKSKSKHSKKDSCVKQSLKKYKTRNSPPYPANKCCGKTKKGNDKKMYISKKKGNSCRWLKKSK
jgi:hypothetical protein